MVRVYFLLFSPVATQRFALFRREICIKKKGKYIFKKIKEIPKFNSLAAEEKFWTTHDSTGYIDFSKIELGFFPELKPSSRTISIRLPESLVESIKILANKQDVPYQSMLKILLAEKVREALNLQQQKGHAA
jgi:predicted DNA binding CopG/RHH family protein